MEPRFLLSSPKTSSPAAHFPFFLSYKSSLLQKPKFSVNSNPSFTASLTEKTPFLGQALSLRETNPLFGSNPRRVRVPLCPIRAAVKKRKERSFDSVIQKDKKLKFVLKVRKILVQQPEWTMPLRELGKYRRDLGLDRKRRFIALLKRFPAVFEIVEEGAYSLNFKMTPAAEALYFEEMKARNGMEDLLVVKLRKLLMMSLEKRILLGKINHLRTDLGLPPEFRDTICHKYPQFFRVVATGRGPALELTHWDPELAVSAAELAEEDNRARELEERDLIIDRPLKFNRVKLPKGLNLSKGEMRRVSQFRDLPYISPYSDFSELKSGTKEKEKHACGVVHELLSLTVEKRTLVDHLTHFREEFRFSQQVRGMLIRHPDLFYVSLKGTRDSVFLREAYHNSQLIDKDRLLVIKEKLRALVDVPRFRGRIAPIINGNKEEVNDDSEEGSETEKDWSDVDHLMNDFGFDDDDDDWSDEGDDDTPPDFGEDETVKIGVSKLVKQVDNSTKNEDKESVLVLPDGRPRERW